MVGERHALVKKLREWQLDQHPSYLLLPTDDHYNETGSNIQIAIFSRVCLLTLCRNAV